jgi:hypothetical protein
MAATYAEIMLQARELHAAGDIEGARRLAKIALERRDAPEPAAAISEADFLMMVWAQVEDLPLILSESEYTHFVQQRTDMHTRLAENFDLRSFAMTLSVGIRLQEFELAHGITSALSQIYHEHLDRAARMGKI